MNMDQNAIVVRSRSQALRQLPATGKAVLGCANRDRIIPELFPERSQSRTTQGSVASGKIVGTAEQSGPTLVSSDTEEGGEYRRLAMPVMATDPEHLALSDRLSCFDSLTARAIRFVLGLCMARSR